MKNSLLQTVMAIGNKGYLSLVLFLLLAYNASAQVVFSNDLDQITTEMCGGSTKKLAVSVMRGTCSVFSGNINSVAFTWQVESSPGVWVGIDSYPVTGITYSIERRINAGGTVITNILTVNSTTATPSVTLTYRVLAQGSGGCPVGTSLTETIAVIPLVWTGAVSSSWTDQGNWNCNRVPLSTSTVVIPATTNPAVISAAVVIKELTIQTGGVLTVNSGQNITVNGPVTVQGTGNFTLQNNANLIQSSYTGPNTGNIRVGRNSSALMRQDYTLWSTPVTGQNLLAFSPLTLTNRFYTYNPDTNIYVSIDPNANSFQTGTGYLIRISNYHPATPTIWNGVFTGVPNNGDIPLTLYNAGPGRRFNAIGNPYPSPIRMSSFVTYNIGKMTGTIYFWRKSNSTVTEPGYCTWTSVGFVSNGEPQVFNPNGIIRTGQGFFVEMANSETDIVFNNTMRIANNADQFFRSENIETDEDGIIAGDKIKLSISSTDGYRNEMLLGYFENATNGVDFNIDGKSLENYPLSLTMPINDEDYAIQGRSLFNDSDIVSLKFKTETAGEFTISVEEVSGLFLSSQDIFLKDRLTDKMHNLKSAPYRFFAEAGTFSNRFELVYAGKAAANSGDVNDVTVFKENNNLSIRATNSLLNSVKVFDIRGRLLNETKSISAPSTSIQMNIENEILLVQITTENGETITKKIMY